MQCTASVVMLLTFTLIIISIPPHPLTFSFQASNLPFLQILPTVAFLIFTDSPDCLPILLGISVNFYFFSFFSVFHFLVVGSVR